MFNIIKIIFIIALFYAIFNIVKFFIVLRKNVEELEKKTGSRKKSRFKSKDYENDKTDSVIELDKDQYKVE